MGSNVGSPLGSFVGVPDVGSGVGAHENSETVVGSNVGLLVAQNNDITSGKKKKIIKSIFNDQKYSHAV